MIRSTRPEPAPAEKPRIRPLDPMYDADEIMRIFALADRTEAFLETERESLRASYPDEWILAGPDGLISHSKSRAVVIRAARRQASSAGLRLELLAQKPRTLIL